MNQPESGSPEDEQDELDRLHDEDDQEELLNREKDEEDDDVLSDDT